MKLSLSWDPDCVKSAANYISYQRFYMVPYRQRFGLWATREESVSEAERGETEADAGECMLKEA